MSMKDVTTTDKGGWKPQPGETLVGTISDISRAEGAFGQYPVVSVDVDDGVVAVHAFHDGLRNQLKTRGAQIGERVSITFTGRAGEGVGTDAYLYSVRVGDEPQAFDYDTLQYTKGKTRPQASSAGVQEVSDDDDLPF